MHAPCGPHHAEQIGSPPFSSYAKSAFRTAWQWGLALLLLILCLPLLCFCALLIYCREGRPVLFTQMRVGQHGRPFLILKFRTMRPIAGLAITAGNDARITRTGRWLRRWKMDEVPQLWNVIKGDMALVGPRPEIPAFVDHTMSEWQAVLAIRPGITGAASVGFHDEAILLAKADDPLHYYRQTLLPQKLSLELAYLKNCSFTGDLTLLWKTGAFFLPFRRETKPLFR